MFIDECGRAFKAGDLSEVVIIRPTIELNSSSLLAEAVLDDTKLHLVRDMGHRSLKILRIPIIP